MKTKPWQLLTPTGLDTTTLSAPLRARSPWRYRVTGDLFASLPFESIAAVLGVVAACPRHEFEVVTVNPERAREWFAWADRLPMNTAKWCMGEAERLGAVIGAATLLKWPLADLRLLTHVTTQAEADARIPVLLACPSAWRGVEVTPGERIELADYLAELTGDCGCLACEEGSTCGKGREVVPPLDLATVRGGTAPLHPNHVRDIRDQCAAARVPFRFEGWGEWMPTFVGIDPNDGDPRSRIQDTHTFSDGRTAWKVGVKAAGRLLDGVTHDGEVT